MTHTVQQQRRELLASRREIEELQRRIKEQNDAMDRVRREQRVWRPVAVACHYPQRIDALQLNNIATFTPCTAWRRACCHSKPKERMRGERVGHTAAPGLY